MKRMRGGLAGIQAALEGQSVAVAEKCHFLCKTWLPSEGINLKPSLLDPGGSRSPLGDEILPLVRVERLGRAHCHGALQEQPWLHCTGFSSYSKETLQASAPICMHGCAPQPQEALNSPLNVLLKAFTHPHTPSPTPPGQLHACPMPGRAAKRGGGGVFHLPAASHAAKQHFAG